MEHGFKRPDQIPYDLLKQKIEAMQDIEKKELACLAYASGSRVSELNHISIADISIKKEHLIIASLVLKKRPTKQYRPDGKLKEPKTKKRYNLIPPPIRYRYAPVKLSETWLVTPILNRVTRLKENPNLPLDTSKVYLFPLHRDTIYRWLKKSLGINPHGFRKLRATHLSQEHNFSSHELQLFFDWSSSAPSDYYVKLNLKDILY